MVFVCRDRGSLVEKLGAFNRTAAGLLEPRTFTGTVARVHTPDDALDYGSYKQSRDLNELRNIVAQLPGLHVVTYAKPSAENPLGHPAGLVKDGVDHWTIGRVISAREVDGNAVAEIYIHDSGALAEIEDGTRELSIGYECTDEGGWQKNIRLDHLSVVWRGRCLTCALNMDGNQVCQHVAKRVPSATTIPMQLAKLNAVLGLTMDESTKLVLAELAKLQTIEPAIEAAPEHKTDCACISHANALNSTGVQMDLAAALLKITELETQVATLKTDADKASETAQLALDSAAADLKAEVAKAEALAAKVSAIETEAKTKVDAAEAKRDEDEQKAFDAAVDARVELLADATKLEIENAKTLDNRAIKVAIVKKVDDMDIDDKKSMDYVNGMYAGAMKRHVNAAASVAEVRTAIVENRDNAETAAPDINKIEADLKNKVAENRKNRWK